ncbi:helix-turn-helix transcriptional regulator [Streptomyces hesseae]|uniref:DNA-binding response regulator n=1 Tax=Streptomyces hesseae TaxID=3075519 RepID=A0ABU2STQ3_9ACTN|nr:DNA-binding response regulator [Streptomyces sp. DSM 40473]MDT0451996.1 DNA-binding response regulator [Streptomyces sp. DSM 40473]
MIRVLLIHDTYLLRMALAALLGREPDLEVSSTSWRGAATAARTTRPDVCVADMDSPDAGECVNLRAADVRAGGARVGGFRAGDGRAGEGRCPEGGGERAAGRTNGVAGARPGDGRPALLALTTAGLPGPLRRAYEAGALGYLSKNASPDRLVEGIRHVAKGERYIDETLGFGFLQAAEIPLTRRELSVLSLAAEGASVGEIARSLHLSNGTVRNYMAAITRKTGARNRVDAIRISRGAGWV